MNFGAIPKSAKSNVLSFRKGKIMNTMNIQDVKNALHSGVAIVSFTKANGEVREMRCTLRSDMIPATPIVEGKTSKKENPDVQAVWDLDKSAWRSFRFDSVNHINLEATV